jgi:hypothetical protein
MTHGNGKIANLPAEIRDELNYRISDGDQGNELVEWLNSRPEVAEVVNKRFDGTPISEQNLSEWRKRGYQKWLAHRNFVDESNALSDNSGDIAETGIDCDKLLLTLTAAYAEATQNWIITPGEQMLYKLAVYKNLTNGVIALQRAELQKVRLEIARERLELLREKRRNKSNSASSAPASSSEPSGRGAGGGQESGEPFGRGAGVGAGGRPGKGGGQESGEPSESAATLAPSSGENPTTSRPKPQDGSQRRDAVPSPSPSTASPPSKPSAGQPPTPVPAPHQTKPAPAASAPATPPHARPTPAYRDPRSRYSLA